MKRSTIKRSAWPARPPRIKNETKETEMLTSRALTAIKVDAVCDLVQVEGFKRVTLTGEAWVATKYVARAKFVNLTRTD